MNLAEIGSAIDEGDPNKFINTYIICLAHGYSIQCPIGSNKDELNKKWSKVLAKYRREFSDEFCEAISGIWFQLLAKCKTDEPRIELQLLKAAGISLDNKNKDDQKDFNSAAEKITALDKKASVEISQDYRDHQKGQTIKLAEFTDLSNRRRAAFNSKDSVDFLISHLTFSKYGDAQPIPRLSVHQNIRSAWEDIIANLYNTIADDLFLEKLTNDWFYLVNQKGIPMDAKDQEELLVIYLAKSKSTQTVIGKKKPNIFKRLFG